MSRVAGGPAPVVAATPAAEPGFDMAGALATAAAEIMAESDSTDMSVTGMADSMVRPVAAYESPEDSQIVSDVLSALGGAQQSGQLRGFGVDVQCAAGQVNLTGRAKSSTQKEQIMSIVRNTPGVSAIKENISIVGNAAVANQPVLDPPHVAARGVAGQSNARAMAAQPMGPQPMGPRPMAAMQASAPIQRAGSPAQYGWRDAPRPADRSNGSVSNESGSTDASHAGLPRRCHDGFARRRSHGNARAHGPVRLGPGAPRYDTPNLPNYAWPGYAAHPNYAAVTYPQQYSPSAWPYIGPFYPYPQVPLGWRKVSLEWDDGWWFLDFTDRDY